MVGGGGETGRRGAWLAALGSGVLGLALLGGAAWLLSSPPQRSGARATLSAVQALAGADTAGYARARAPRPFEWPADHGPHPAFRTEWWYVTGNLETSTGRRFGLQLTFFRNTVAPELPDRESGWNTSQLWLAHTALTDVEGERHLESERVARGAAGIAGGSADPFRVWLDSWALRGPAGGVSESGVALESEDPVPPAAPGGLADARERRLANASDRGLADATQTIFPLELTADGDDWAATLTLNSAKPPVLQGDRGWSRKGPEPGNASYYYSFTRMPAEGWVEIAGLRMEVSGLMWMDREWSTSALGPEHLGWDWFSIQLSDDREIMFFELRRRDGSADPLDHGILVQPDGTASPLGSEDVEVEVLGSWESPLDGTVYPSGWSLRVPGHGIDLTLRPVIRDQEMDLTFRYWEGAVTVEGTGAPGSLEGRGYVELTGYAETSGPPVR